MSKNIIVSNRLPVKIVFEKDKLEVTPSVGGLATGLKSVHKEGNGVWIGWSGLDRDTLNKHQEVEVDKALLNEKCVAVPLNQHDIDEFYLGFSNKTLWPLFHYFTEYTEFEYDQWLSYKEVNQKFAEVVLANSKDGDTIWVHDYQLLLLPELLKEERPNSKIGLFLHIPYPSFEIFRIFPWREQLLRGMLGADLIGFHTYDYERHFLSSVKRILRLETNFNQISLDDRIIKVDSFPMGIDYKKFFSAALLKSNTKEEEKSDLQLRLEDHMKNASGTKLILSIDRLDYTKGIPNRVRAYEYFLENYPEYKEKVRLIMLAVPSRTKVPQYQMLKRETDELVGRVNGKFSTVNWTPIWYFYRSIPFDNLIDLYTASDVALITPLRDGMNLVAKEYVATRTNQDGVLILSEMAGASKEMNEALIINPNNFEQFSEAMIQAFNMPIEEQKERMKILQNRLKRYNVEKWAEEFMKSLMKTNQKSPQVKATAFSVQKIAEVQKYNKAQNRLVLLDYDGTLSAFKDNPQEAYPDKEMYGILDQIAAQENTTLCLISGRDKETFDKWFPNKPYSLITDHGVWHKKPEKDWEELAVLKNDWMESILPILETFSDNTPGTFVEKKKFSLAWHYRKVDPELAQIRVVELNTMLNSLIANHDLSVLDGDKVLEIKSGSINKGKASNHLLANQNFDYILCMGDDFTDEYMFEELPDFATTIKVGFKKTKAKYYIKDTIKVREFLKELL